MPSAFLVQSALVVGRLSHKTASGITLAAVVALRCEDQHCADRCAHRVPANTGRCNRLLDEQIADAPRPRRRARPRQAACSAISAPTTRVDDERRGIVRSMQLMSDEATGAHARDARETASQLQADPRSRQGRHRHRRRGRPHRDLQSPPASACSATRRGRGHRALARASCCRSSRSKQRSPTSSTRLAARLDDTQVDLARARDAGPAAKDGTSFRGRDRRQQDDAQPAHVSTSSACATPPIARPPKRRCATAKRATARWSSMRPRSSSSRRRPEPLRRRQRERRALLQDGSRGAARRAARTCSARRMQPDGSPSFGVDRAHIERRSRARRRCSNGCSAMRSGNDIPCEVRWVRLPVPDGTADPRQHHRHHRAQAHRAARGRRAARVRENRLAANVDLRVTLEAITRSRSNASAPTAAARIACSMTNGRRLNCAPARDLPPRVRARRWTASPVGGAQRLLRRRRLSAAPGHRRRHRARRAVGERARGRAAAGLRSCWSTLIVASDGRVLGTLALYLRHAAQPGASRLRADGAHDAARRHRDRAAHAEDALRASEARYRRLFDNVMEGVYSSTRDGRFLSVNPALVQHGRLLVAEELLRARPPRRSIGIRRSASRSSCAARARRRSAQRRVPAAAHGRHDADGDRERAASCATSTAT